MGNDEGDLPCTTTQGLDTFARLWSIVTSLAVVGLVVWIYMLKQKSKRNGDFYKELSQDDEKVEKYQRMYNEEKREKDIALQRLSKVMSNRLTDGNPNIADLSDEKRPTKLAEEYSELYDNAWSDAYESVSNKHDAKAKTDFLRLILQECYKWCTTRSEEQLQQLNKVIMCPIRESGETGSKMVSKEFMKNFKDERKIMAKDTAEHLVDEAFMTTKKHFQITQWKEEMKSKPVEIYCKQCAMLCWMMVVQDPPMHIDFAAKDKHLYKSYTKSGKEIEFIVWPPLSLCQGGNLMRKGIAQFK